MEKQNFLTIRLMSFTSSRGIGIKIISFLFKILKKIAKSVTRGDFTPNINMKLFE